jgi:hypothetical protein
MASTKQLCTFFVGDGYFGIPVEQVQEIVRPQPRTTSPESRARPHQFARTNPDGYRFASPPEFS